jgi:hypothetical protein
MYSISSPLGVLQAWPDPARGQAQGSKPLLFEPLLLSPLLTSLSMASPQVFTCISLQAGVPACFTALNVLALLNGTKALLKFSAN